MTGYDVIRVGQWVAGIGLVDFFIGVLLGALADVHSLERARSVWVKFAGFGVLHVLVGALITLAGFVAYLA